MAQTAQPLEFKVGLALAGAISAGAYTGGVIDFLIQALEEWEAARGLPGVAQHRTGIKVVTGASAGAITGALGVVALARGPQPTPLSAEEIAQSHRVAGRDYGALRCVLPQLYETWVKRPRMVADRPGEPDLLSLEDLARTKDRPASVGSVLNGKLLDAIKDAALQAGNGAPQRPPKPYLANPLHVYMTVSNLRGIPFTLNFGASPFGMQTHGDRMHYRVAGIGCWDCEDCDWLKHDTAMAVDVATLPVAAGQAVPADWDQYGTAALASAAFPIGLSSRALATTYGQYTGRGYPLDIPPDAVIAPRFPGSAAATDQYRFLNVDGGLINNNPYDYAEYALLDRPANRRQPDADGDTEARQTDAAVVMVAPFPEPPPFLPEGQPQPELVALVRALLPTLMTQARFRPSELAKALDPKNYSRYLVAPMRTLPGKAQPERFTIACGLLGGFGGFLDERFRAHDYQLGRRNCQQFLAESFGLPVDAAAIDAPDGARRMTARAEQPPLAPVIPLMGEAAREVALPQWPRMTEADLDILMARVKTRLGRVLPILLATQTSSKWLRLVGSTALLLGRGRVLESIRFAVLSELVRRDQIEGWTLPAGLMAQPDDVRAVLAELMSPSFDYRTAAGIAAATHIAPAAVAAILQALREEGGKLQVVEAPWNSGLLTLKLRQATGPLTLPGIASVARWFDPPHDDRAMVAAAAA